ncbi:MAG: NTP transferase domain-containing protein [Lachnospiraceae bacterium]|nr:NTP transferase domain-containing protein [Lachnospiraceae bacterium]
MNIQESDILKTIYKEPFVSQRILAESSGHSLGVVNRSLKYLTGQGYISNDMRLTSKGIEEIEKNRPANAIILAAGVGMRMVPINAMTPKGLLAVKGEPLVERLIRQLHEVNVTDITIVVGFMKERFDHLIDKYGVKLVVNTDYADKNNLHSLALAAGGISNTYIVPCDVWAAHNPFSLTEMYSWYMVSDAADIRSDVRVNRKMELVSIPENSSGNAMIGIAYILAGDAQEIRDKIKEMASGAGHDDDFWEAALYSGGKMSLAAKVVQASDVSEIDTYEQLRKLDGDSDHLRSDALDTIAGVLSCTTKEIRDITVLKKGMTNRSFLFTLRDRKYIMRIPGEGTDRLINRRQEAEVYKAIKGYGFCDDPVYIDPVNGYKITEYLEGVRVCDAASEEDLCRCMEKLKEMHSRKLQVGHEFDIFGQILFYEKLWNGVPSAYRDYDKTKQNVFSLKGYVEEQPKDRCLTHIDAVPDNFLFYQTEGGEKLQLTDWEYSGMQDPHVDLAMFSIYSYFDKKQIDRLMDIYFGCEPPHMIRAKIYCYVAACGLLWSNWTEYKSTLGVEFGEYGLKQYRYAKDFYAYAREEMELDRRSKE